MGIVRYYWQVLRVAFSHSLSAAQSCIFLAVVLAGVFPHIIAPRVGMMTDPGWNQWAAELTSWKVAAAVLGTIVLIRLVCAPYWLYTEMRSQRDDALSRLADARAETGLKANTKPRALNLLIGQGSDFEAVETFASGVSSRFISIGVQNNGDGYLSECTLWIVDASPAREGFKPFSAFSDATLLPGQTKYARVFRFHEAGELSRPPHNAIILCEPWKGGFFRRDNSIPPLGRDEATIISLKAIARESASTEAHCRVWIDQDRKLRVEAV